MSTLFYSRNCPKCNREVIHTTEASKNWALKSNRPCRGCSQIGRKFSEESKHKMSLAKIGKPTWSSINKEEFGRRHSGKNHPMYGKRQSEDFKCQQRNRMLGNKVSSDTKRKLRIAAIKQHRENGVSFPSIDVGATEYFDFMNEYNGFHIQHPNIEIPELGYFVDGYDPTLHAIFEYDTKSHNSGRCKKKDLERENEIIAHFNYIYKPLKHFYRVNRTGFGEQGLKDVLNNRG